MEDKGEVLYELSPKFDFFYELTMPTGKKMKSAFTAMVVAIVFNIVFLLGRDYVTSSGDLTIKNVYNVCSIIFLIVLVVTILMFISKIAFQVMEYKGIKYKFYKNCLVFENNFLSQTKKTIEYANIREVEIRRTVMDRMLNYGVIIIYTNADKAYGSATILYAIKNTQEHYNNIESIIHNGNIITNPIRTSDGGAISYNDEEKSNNVITMNNDEETSEQEKNEE